VNAEFSQSRRNRCYGLQAMYSSMALKSGWSVHMWTPHSGRKWGVRTPQDRRHWKPLTWFHLWTVPSVQPTFTFKHYKHFTRSKMFLVTYDADITFWLDIQTGRCLHARVAKHLKRPFQLSKQLRLCLGICDQLSPATVYVNKTTGDFAFVHV